MVLFITLNILSFEGIGRNVCTLKEGVHNIKRFQDNFSRSRAQTKQEIRYLQRTLEGGTVA